MKISLKSKQSRDSRGRFAKMEHKMNFKKEINLRQVGEIISFLAKPNQ